MEYKYFAFISFQSSDAREALWLQKQIENYSIPRSVRKSNGNIPKRLRPCFCYLNDINLSEELMQELKKKMEQSEYLIVVCSPNSAKSSFVNGGIEYFVNLGRRDKIIPLIVAGKPYSSVAETECYPETLRRHFPKHTDPMQDHQILGVNINEEGAGSKRWKRKRALLMVIARMLGLQFENLWNRDVKRRREQKLGISALVFMVLLALSLTFYFSKNVSIRLQLQESTISNDNLPPLQDGTIVLQLENEEKTINNLSLSADAAFENIPRRFLGKDVRLSFMGKDYLPLDTILELRRQMTIPIKRDSTIYGDIHFRLRFQDGHNPQKAKIDIVGHQCIADRDGQVVLHIPLVEQQTVYPVMVNQYLQEDSLYMPCGENDIFIAQ